MRVLVVEDEPDLCATLAKALKEEGYAVDTALDGEQALYLAMTWEYDAILLDVMLPVMDGWEVLRCLRLQRTTPVMMLTARDGVSDRVRGLDGGSDDYLVKPFELRELLARVRALIRRTSGVETATNLVDLGGIEVDFSKRILSENGKVIELTAREFALVEMLVRHRGRVVSRTELYDHLFAEEDESCSNLLDVHVCNVRKKVSREFIVTRRGMGYQIEID